MAKWNNFRSGRGASADDRMYEYLAATKQHRVECPRCDKEVYERGSGPDVMRVCSDCK